MLLIFVPLGAAIFLQRNSFAYKPTFDYISLDSELAVLYGIVPIWALFALMQTVLLLGLIDWRNWKRRIHLDLVLISTGFSLSFLLYAMGGVTAPALLFMGSAIYTIFVLVKRSFSRSPQSLSPSLPTWFFILFIILFIPIYGFFAFGFGSFDVGYSSVVGADRIMHGEDVYGNFPPIIDTGDTYGPFMYLAYIPFEILLPWQGKWDYIPAARAGVLFFFLAMAATLFFLGKKFYNKKTGLVMSFSLLSFPANLLPLHAVTNDTLPPLLILLALLAASKAPLRGFLAGAGAMTKWFPLLLAPLLSKLDSQGISNLREARFVNKDSLWNKSNLSYWFFFAFSIFALMLYHIISPGLSTIYENSLAQQFNRDSPYSFWWYIPQIESIVKPLLTGLLVFLGISFLFIRQNLTLPLVTSLIAILLLLFQLNMEYWYFTYFIWVSPFILLAFFLGKNFSKEPAEEERNKKQERRSWQT